MKLIDTHTHLYLDNYSDDRNEVVQNAINHDVDIMLLPAIDSSTYESMMDLSSNFPNNCLPMMGLHPTSVKDDYEVELKFVDYKMDNQNFVAIGEIGIDLYWDDTYFEQQKDAFRRQLKLAKKHQLPAVIHTRDSFNEIYPILKEESTDELIGIFHCFTGTIAEANKIIELGFSMGIGGIVTFKNSGLSETVKDIHMKHLVLETDSPFLTPVPYRGKRNQSSYLTYVAQKMADIKGVSLGSIVETTTANANNLFKMN